MAAGLGCDRYRAPAPVLLPPPPPPARVIEPWQPLKGSGSSGTRRDGVNVAPPS